MKNKLKIIRRKENEKHTNGNEINRIKRISSKNSVSKRKKNCKLINTSHEATADPVRHFFRGFFSFNVCCRVRTNKYDLNDYIYDEQKYNSFGFLFWDFLNNCCCAYSILKSFFLLRVISHLVRTVKYMNVDKKKLALFKQRKKKLEKQCFTVWCVKIDVDARAYMITKTIFNSVNFAFFRPLTCSMLNCVVVFY